MARTPISTDDYIDLDGAPESLYGIVIDDITWETMVAGVNNGVTFEFHESEAFILHNPTGGAAVFTIIIETPTDFSSIGVNFPDRDITVAAGKTHWVTVDSRLMESANRTIRVDCDVAGQIAIVKRYTIT